MKYIELESERLIFRKFKQNDFPVVFDWLNNLENMKYRSSEPKNEEEAHQYLNYAIESAEEEDCINFRYAVVKKEDNTLIGSCELYYTDTDPQNSMGITQRLLEARLWNRNRNDFIAFRV